MQIVFLNLCTLFIGSAASSAIFLLNMSNKRLNKLNSAQCLQIFYIFGYFTNRANDLLDFNKSILFLYPDASGGQDIAVCTTYVPTYFQQVVSGKILFQFSFHYLHQAIASCNLNYFFLYSSFHLVKICLATLLTISNTFVSIKKKKKN